VKAPRRPHLPVLGTFFPEYREKRAQMGGVGVGVGLVALFFVAGALLPNGLPVGIVLLGVVLGGLQALTAMGIVLVYRATRAINFAQAEIGALAAGVATVLIAGWGLPYFAALPLGLLAAVATGALIDAVVVRRLFTAPRLILTVATIGVAQLLGAFTIVLPTWFTHLRPFSTFTTPFRWHTNIGPLLFTGDHLMAVVAVPVVGLGLWWFLGRTSIGIAIRAAADSGERALLLGIPVRRLSMVTWMVAAGLSGLGAMLSAPVVGANVGVIAGPSALLVPLAAAVIARMESLPRTALAAIGIAVLQQGIYWSYPQSATVDALVFAVLLLALLVQRRGVRRVTGADLGDYVAVEQVRPVSKALLATREVRVAKVAGAAVVVAAAVLVPLAASDSQRTLLGLMAIYGIIAVSLVVLTGWAGEISLGQFAFVGIGAATTASLLVHAHADLFVALIASALAGGVAAVLVGVPALRIPGLFLAVVTLGFAVPVSSWLLSSRYFPLLNPVSLLRPKLFGGRVSIESPLSFYFFCLVLLVLVLAGAHNLRHSRAGRVLLAVRDNERGAAAFGADATRLKLVAFGLSGALAGLGGGLYAVALRGVSFGSFNAEHSVVVFTMVVVGGLGSISGALAGAAYVKGAEWFLHGAAQLLATGAGLLLLLLVAPGGIASGLYRLRDAALAWVARRHGLDPRPSGVKGAPTPPQTPPEAPAARDTDEAFVDVRNVNASYGHVQILFGVDLQVARGEVVALLGTNGAGKSTLLRAITGVLRSASGDVRIGGRDLGGLSAPARVRAGMAMVPGGKGVFPSLTVAEHLRLAQWTQPADASASATDGGGVERALELFPSLRDRLHTRANLLSGGEQQMLAVAQALLCRPEVLLIDELSLGLSPAVVGVLLDVVRALNAAGTTVVIVEQSLNVAASIAPRAVFLERGTVRYDGPTADLLDRPDLARAVFLPDRAPATPKRSKRRAGPVSTNGHTPSSLDIIDVGKTFGGVAALHRVSLAAKPGEIVGIIGANGAGKTTLLDVVSGFLGADTGRIHVDGVDITDDTPSDRAELGLGRVFQDARLFPTLTVRETLAVALERHVDVRDPIACLLPLKATRASERAVDARVDELLDTLTLALFADSFVSELSTGTRRLVELACVLAHQPRVLLLDEPTSGVAQREGEAMAGLLTDLRDQTGATLVIVEHDVPLVAGIADRLVCLHLGSVIADGPPGEVLQSPEVITSYLGTVGDSGNGARAGRGKPVRRRSARAGAGGR
jgi:ABC-type branched-subunit amino acid transport system ATPase component/ABC-type branched-subunit amino acid transport system permease subunit